VPHFVVTEFHGKRNYAVEFFYDAKRADGSDRWPQPIDAIEINETLATYPIADLINLYEKGIRPKRPTKPLAIAAPEKPALQTAILTTNSVYGKMAALPQPRNEMG
jgi:hypothetical protein